MSAPRVVIVDYGRGNLFSLRRALEILGAEPVVSSDPGEILRAKRLLLPGVGAFGDGMEGLHSRGLAAPVKEFGESGRPLLGICLGLQLLLEESEEFGRHPGLGLVRGKVVRFPDPAPEGPRYKVPHIGWNKLTPAAPRASWEGTILHDLPWESSAYFVHSFVVEPENPRHRLAETVHGGRTFCSALSAGNVAGCQFHPEKSGDMGLKLLANWLAERPAPVEAAAWKA